MAAQGDGRKLQAEGSNPDAPEKKSARTDGSVEVDMEEVMPPWAKFMMDRIVGKVENVEVQVAAAEKAANEAKLWRPKLQSQHWNQKWRRLKKR